MLRGLIASFVLLSLCVVIHSFGLVLLADWLLTSVEVQTRNSVSGATLRY